MGDALVTLLSHQSPTPVTYAGGSKSMVRLVSLLLSAIEPDLVFDCCLAQVYS